MRRIVMLLAVVPLLASACGGSESTHTINGTMSLQPKGGALVRYASLPEAANGGLKNGAVDCSPGAPGTGYDDIATGTAVTVTNEKGTTIGTTTLGKGTIRLDPYIRCEFVFAVSVPGAKFYGVEVAHRGVVQKSFEELESDGWAFGVVVES